MVATQIPPPTSTAEFQKRLEYLYLRKQLVDDLILALEVYALMARDRSGNKKSARGLPQPAVGL